MFFRVLFRLAVPEQTDTSLNFESGYKKGTNEPRGTVMSD